MESLLRTCELPAYRGKVKCMISILLERIVAAEKKECFTKRSCDRKASMLFLSVLVNVVANLDRQEVGRLSLHTRLPFQEI